MLSFSAHLTLTERESKVTSENEMKDDYTLPTTTSTETETKKDESCIPTMDWSPLGKIRYKFWALTAIIFLAFWSLFTGTLTLKSSTGNLSHFYSGIDSDLDILEVEEREKVVRNMWDVYTHSTTIRLPRFWQDAFEAAYEYLVSDVPGVEKDAVLEIAKMSMHSMVLQLPPDQSTMGRGKTRKILSDKRR